VENAPVALKGGIGRRLPGNKNNSGKFRETTREDDMGSGQGSPREGWTAGGMSQPYSISTQVPCYAPDEGEDEGGKK